MSKLRHKGNLEFLQRCDRSLYLPLVLAPSFHSWSSPDSTAAANKAEERRKIVMLLLVAICNKVPSTYFSNAAQSRRALAGLVIQLPAVVWVSSVIKVQ